MKRNVKKLKLQKNVGSKIISVVVKQPLMLSMKMLMVNGVMKMIGV
jgi:hypothetical protein